MDNGSRIDIIVVIPAKNTHKKNNGPIIYEKVPILLKTVGKAINIRPVPSVTTFSTGTCSVNDINPSIENTPIAVNNSKLQLAIVTIVPSFTILGSSGR